MTRKEELRAIMIDIIAGREKVQYCPNDQEGLLIGLGEVLTRRGHDPTDVPRSFLTPTGRELGVSDRLLAMEIFWDLILDRIITPGLNGDNPLLPNFRVHSEAVLDAH